MSQKKRKKRRPQGNYEAQNARQRQELAASTDPGSTEKRLNPTARNLLLGDLVLLAVVGLLTNNGLISDVLSSILSVVGIILMLAALWIQFGRKQNPGGRDSWPDLR